MQDQVIVGRGAHARYLGALTGFETIEYECIADVDPEASLIIGVGDPLKRLQWWHSLWANKKKLTGVVLSMSAHGDVEDDATVMPEAFIAKSAMVCANALINTRAIIEHDAVVGGHSVVSSGAILCGGVTLGPVVFIGAGAVICPGVTVPGSTFIKAGSVIGSDDDARNQGRCISSIRVRKTSRRSFVTWWKDL